MRGSNWGRWTDRAFDVRAARSAMLFHRRRNVSQALPAASSNLYGCHLGSIVVVQRYALYTRIVAGSRVRLQF